MGKFKREYQYQYENYPKWQTNFISYIDAKSLINKITSRFEQTKTFQEIESNTSLYLEEKETIMTKVTQTNRSKSIESFHLVYHTFINQKEDLESLFSMDQGSTLKDLFHTLDESINHLYYFYCKEEKELYKSLNSHLHLADNYGLLSLFQLTNEASKLKLLLQNTESLCSFLDLNMKCIQKICYQIDKKLKKPFNKGSIALKYLREKLSNPNSNLNYILQYKIIDEASAIGSFVNELIIEYSSTIKEGNNLKEILILNTYSTSLNNSLLQSKRSTKSKRFSINSNNSGNLFLSEEDRKQLNVIDKEIDSTEKEYETYQTLQNEIAECSKSITNSIRKIDEDQHFRVKFKNYCISIRYGFKAIGKSQYLTGIQLEEEQYDNVINCLMDEELIIKQFLPKKGLNEYIKGYNLCVSEVNSKNIKIMLMHTFILNSLYPIELLSPFYVQKFFQSIKSLKFFFISSSGIHLGLIISNFLYGTILSNSKHYKLSLLLSAFFLLIGFSLFHIIKLFSPNFYKGGDLNFILCITAQKIAFGIGVSSLISRKYLVTYSSRPLIRNTIKGYHLASKFGVMLGFFISSIITTLQALENGIITIIINTFYYLNIMGIVLVCSITFYIIIYFTNPTDKFFPINKPLLVDNDNEDQNDARKILKVISNEETHSITKANRLLNEDNKKADYTNTNLIQIAIKAMLKEEKSCYSYRQRSFLGLFLISFFNYMLPEISFFFLFVNNTKSGFIVYIFPLFCIWYALASMISYLIQYKTKLKFIERYWITAFITINVILTHALIFIPYSSFGYFVLGCFIWLMVIFLNCLINNQCNRLLKKIIPQKFNLCSFNVSLYLSELEYVSKFIAYLVLILFMIVEKKNEWVTDLLLKDKLVIYYWFIIIFLFQFVVAIIFFPSLRLKAIARIFKKNLY